MATRMNVSINYGTHLGILISAIEKTTGPILELGMGVFSTPYLHYASVLNNRKVVSYENFEAWAKFFMPYKTDTHEIIVIKDWPEAKIEMPWDVALVDHTPGNRRKEEIKRLANYAKYIVVHDSNGRYEKEYGYSEIYPLFKFRRNWENDRNQACVLSNFADPKDLW